MVKSLIVEEILRLGLSKGFVILLTMTIVWFSAPCLARKQVQIPLVSQENVKIDQAYNIVSHKPLGKSERAIVPIFHVDVPVGSVEAVHLSKYLDDDTRDNAWILKGGKRYVRFFFESEDHPVYSAIRKELGAEAQVFWGTKVQSHNTYLVWSDVLGTRFYVKFPSKDGVTRADTVENAIAVNDYVESVLDEDPKDTFVSVLPERFAAAFDYNGYVYAFSMRSAVAKRVPRNANGSIKMLPLHGFLGSPKLKEMAAKKGVSEQQWLLDEYVPKLAKFMARLNFHYGLYPAAHTQNLQFFLDESSGEILGFAFRDLNDTAIDPFVRIIKGKIADFLSVRGIKNISRLHRWHTGSSGDEGETDKKHGFGPGWVNGGYIGYWNLYSLAGNADFFRELLHRFFSVYTPEVERLTGVELKREKLPSPDAKSIGWKFPGYDLFQAIYEQVVSGMAKPVGQRADRFDQKTLFRIFKNHYLSTRQVALLRPDARLEIDFKLKWGWLIESWLELTYDGTHLIAFDRYSKKPVAYVYGLEATEHATARAAQLPSATATGKSPNSQRVISRQSCEAVF